MTRFGMELRRTARDRSLLALLLLFGLATVLAGALGERRSSARAAALVLIEQEATDTIAQRRALLVAEQHGGAKAKFATIFATATPFRATLPLAPGAALAIGRSEAFPAAAAISPFASPEGIFDRFTTGLENPAALAAGRFDLAFVIVVLLPLLVLAASYDLWTDERERGTLPMIAAQPVASATLLGDRVAARAVLLLPMAAILSLVLTVATHASGGFMAATLLVLLLYGAFWLMLATLVNVVARRSTSALMACGAAWLLVVVALPAGAAAMLEWMSPPPSRVEHLDRARAETAAARTEAWAWADAHPAAFDPARRYNKLLWTQRREAALRDRRIAPFAATYHAAEDRNGALADRLLFLSPAIIAQDALERLAGTDAARARAFARQARAFVRDTRAYSDRYMGADRTLGVDDYDHGLPRFGFREPPITTALLVDLAALFAAVALVGSAIAWRVRGDSLDRTEDQRDA